MLTPAPGLLGQAHLDPRRQGLLALAASRDADGRAHADAWRRRRVRQRWRRQRGEEEARERYREGLIGAFAAGDAEGLLPGAARGSSAGGGFDLGNIGRGIGERAGDLGGGLLGAVNAAAGYLERRLPLGGIDLERGLYGPGAPPARNLGEVAARRLEDLDLGYAPGTTWEEVKRSPASKAIAFAVEQGLVSVPDMAAALASLPAYVLARTGELAGARAEADLRKDATVGDLVAALPGAAASALLERLGARRILGIGDALGSRSLRGVAGAAGRGSAVEGGTETAQEGIEHLTSRLGTATGVAPHEMADAMMAGGAAGAIFGGGVRGATATGQALLGRRQARESGAGAPAEARSEPTPAASGIRRVIVAAARRGHNYVKQPMGQVSEWLREEAAAHGLALDGYRATLDTPAVRHVIREHGDELTETARGQIPVTEADFEALPDALATAEKIAFGIKNRRSQDGVAFLKTLPDGSTLVITEVRTGRGELALASLRKYPGTMNADSVLATLDPNARGDTGDGVTVVDRPEGVKLFDDVTVEPRNGHDGTPRPVGAQGGGRPTPPTGTEAAPVRLTGEELVPFNAPFDDLRDAALDWYNDNLVDTGFTVTNEHDGRVIRFERAGARKTKSAGEGILRLVPAIPEMLRLGLPLDSRPDRKGRPEIRAWHRYAATAETGGVQQTATLTVRERPDGTFHYSLHREAESAGTGSVPGARTTGGKSQGPVTPPSLESGPDADENIDQSAPEVNDR